MRGILCGRQWGGVLEMPNALIDILTGKDAKAAYALLLQLEEQSERDPGLYPLLGDFLAMLESDNSLVRARGFRLTVAQALWDSDNVIDSRIDDVLALLRDPKGTTARQSLQFAYVLLDAKPYLFPYVAEALESMDLSRYPDGIRPLIADDANRLASQADECRRLFLRPTDWIDWGDEAVLNRAALIGRGSGGVVDLAEATFEFVRDEIAHSYDVGCHVPAAKASDVLKTGASICWGKANLLAALLRANGI
ncbi:MAG: transglutaminase domain-containing protein, partial [Coriobacteriia bacterium]|nr:transglutaminase domain-containing protein [Coriobacteriia bacterium]